MGSAPEQRPVRWYGIPVRVLLLTFVGTLLCFSVSLLFAIVATVAVASWHGVHADMRAAYRHIAIPMAGVEGAVILVIASVIEVRDYRQRKTLDALERMG